MTSSWRSSFALVMASCHPLENDGAGHDVAGLPTHEGADVRNGLLVDPAQGHRATASAATLTALMPFSGSTPACAFLPWKVIVKYTDVGDQ